MCSRYSASNAWLASTSCLSIVRILTAVTEPVTSGLVSKASTQGCKVARLHTNTERGQHSLWPNLTGFIIINLGKPSNRKSPELSEHNKRKSFFSLPI